MINLLKLEACLRIYFFGINHKIPGQFSVAETCFCEAVSSWHAKSLKIYKSSYFPELHRTVLRYNMFLVEIPIFKCFLLKSMG